jgi:hypothetical protein
LRSPGFFRKLFYIYTPPASLLLSVVCICMQSAGVFSARSLSLSSYGGVLLCGTTPNAGERSAGVVPF